jgi:DHA2 family multidrug resistance protein
MWNIVWPNLINGFANGFLFVPLTPLTMGTLSNEQMGRGTGIYNLTRNMGASFGISMVTTLLVRDAQRHQNLMAGRMNPGNPVFRAFIDQLHTFFALHAGFAAPLRQACALAYRILVQQATLWAYVTDFRLLACLTLACVPFLLLFRRGGLRRTGDLPH